MGNINLQDWLGAISTGERGLYEFALSVVMSILFGVAYVMLYRLWRADEEAGDLAQGFLFIAPAVTAIFWVIQYSLPLSLGLLGALSFVRFRTPVKRADDIAFILLVIASSLSCAVYRFGVALVLAVAVLLIILAKKQFGGSRWVSGSRRASLFVSFSDASKSEGIPAKLEALIETVTGSKGKLVNSSVSEGTFNMHYSVAKKGTKGTPEKLLAEVKKSLTPERVELFFEDA